MFVVLGRAGRDRDHTRDAASGAGRQEADLPFNKCTVCGQEWATRDAFISDPQVTAIGYQVSFESLEDGCFLFNHSRADCRTTLSLGASVFFDLYEGPIYQERKTGSAQCPGYCLHTDELRICPARCECAFVRELLQIIIKWPKRVAA